MKTIFLTFFLCIFLSCKKEPKVFEITYQVILLNATTWSGSYLDENGNIIDVTRQKSGWQYVFKDTKGLHALMLSAKPDTYNNYPDALMTIYVDGKRHASGSYQKDGYLSIPFNIK